MMWVRFDVGDRSIGYAAGGKLECWTVLTSYARGYNVIQYKDSVIPDQNYVWSYAGIRSHNYYKSDLEYLSVLVHIT